jgi:SAM-dependent methyltransferase
MSDPADLKPPEGLDLGTWLERYDRMQEQYVMTRGEPFELMVRLIRETQDPPIRVLDLGCGTGALMYSLLEALPQAQTIGIDLDPTALWLAGARLERFGKRHTLIAADFLDPSWPETVDGPLAAVVSSQTVHMLNADQVEPLYQKISEVLRPGGIFLSVDHVRSDSPAIQGIWDRQRAEARANEGRQDGEDWHGFWEAYSRALGVDISEVHGPLYGGRERKRERLPLIWHLDRLLASRFTSAECFWRREYDALYGGERGL